MDSMTSTTDSTRAEVLDELTTDALEDELRRRRVVADLSSGRIAADGCEHWCSAGRDEHEEFRNPHRSISESVPLGSGGAVFASLWRPYVDGLPLCEVDDRPVKIEVSVDDDPPTFRLPMSAARSFAAALIRLAELAEATPRRG